MLMVMRKYAVILALAAALNITAAAQTNTSTRPRVAATPTPPVLQSDSNVPTRKDGPPVLQGSTPRAGTTPTPDGKVDDENEIIKVDTELVTMPVSVLDRDGRFISGLQQKDFQIFENGVQQQVEYFQSVEQPFTVILLLDVSPSTQYRIDEIQSAAVAFVDQLRPSDRVMVISFDERVHVLSPATSNRMQLRNAIYMAEFGNGTSLYEAVDYAIEQEMRYIKGRKAVVLFTDGVDTTSRRASYQSTEAKTEETDSLFYAVRYDTSHDLNGGMTGSRYPTPNRRPSGRVTMGDILGAILMGGNVNIGSGGAPGGGSAQEYATGKQYLETISRNSGGRYFEADSMMNIRAAFTGIAEELRRQYSLGYYPATQGTAGERRQIRVRVMRPGVVVRAKNSYIVGRGSSNKLAGI